MARFSQGFLSNLGRPAMTQSLFDLGTAIGNVPNQYQEKKKRDADAAELATATTQPERMRILASQLERDGKTAQAQEVRLKAKALERQGVLEGQQDKLFGQQQTKFKQEQEDRERREKARLVGVDFAKLTLEQVKDSELATKAQRTKAENLLRVMNDNPESAEAFSKQALDLGDSVGVSISDQADLSENFTSESVQEFMKAYREGKPVDGLLKAAGGGLEIKRNSVEDINGVPTLVTVWEDRSITTTPLGGMELRTKVQEEILADTNLAREASARANTLATLEAEVANRSFVDKGAFGSIFKGVSDFFGAGGDKEVLRTKLTQLRNSEAISMLPKGPASDKDIAMVLEGSVDLNNISNKDAESYLRGLRKIALAEERYLKARNAIRRKTNSLGSSDEAKFDQYLAAKRTVENLRGQDGVLVNKIEERLEMLTSGTTDPKAIAAGIQNMREAYAAEVYGAEAVDAVVNKAAQAGYFRREAGYADFVREYF